MDVFNYFLFDYMLSRWVCHRASLILNGRLWTVWCLVSRYGIIRILCYQTSWMRLGDALSDIKDASRQRRLSSDDTDRQRRILSDDTGSSGQCRILSDKMDVPGLCCAVSSKTLGTLPNSVASRKDVTVPSGQRSFFRRHGRIRKVL